MSEIFYDAECFFSTSKGSHGEQLLQGTTELYKGIVPGFITLWTQVLEQFVQFFPPTKWHGYVATGLFAYIKSCKYTDKINQKNQEQIAELQEFCKKSQECINVLHANQEFLLTKIEKNENDINELRKQWN